MNVVYHPSRTPEENGMNIAEDIYEVFFRRLQPVVQREAIEQFIAGVIQGFAADGTPDPDAE
jgi:hypothetical protein